MEEITWKDVLDSSKKHYGHVQLFLGEVLIPSGYQYFTWNDLVYRYDYESNKISATNWSIGDVR